MKTYEEYLKLKNYSDTARILLNYPETRDSYKKLVITFYREIYGMTLDEAFQCDDIVNFQTVGRMARRLKAVNHSLRGSKDTKEEEGKYKQIALDIPVVVEVI